MYPLARIASGSKRAGAVALILMLVLCSSAEAASGRRTARSDRFGTGSALETAHRAAASRQSARGINSGWLFYRSVPQWSKWLTSLQHDGYEEVRAQVSWAAVEASPPDAITGAHRYDWTSTDAMVGALAQDGMRLFPFLLYSPAWAASRPGSQNSAPRDPSTYATFAAAFARRYAARGDFWREHPALPAVPVQSVEVWNEPNAARFLVDQRSAPADYAALYDATRTAVHNVDRSVEVVAGALVDAWASQFLTRMIQARPRLKRTLPALSFHPYANSGSSALAAVTRLRRTMNEVGLRKVPLDLTEIGFSSTVMTDPARSIAFETFFKGARRSSLGIRRVMPFAAVSPEKDPTDWVQWFGLYNQDGTPKPVATRLSVMLRGG